MPETLAMDASRILQLCNHLMRQTEERRAYLIAEGLKLADEDLQMKIEAKARSALAAKAAGRSSPTLRK